MINTETLKVVGKNMMLVGGIVFGTGFGVYSTANVIETKEARKNALESSLELESERAAKEHSERVKKLRAETKKNEVLADRIEHMDQKQFAKFQAEETKKASEEAINTARDLVSEAKGKMSALELECSEKVSRAVKKQVEAQEKYDKLLAEYKNRDEVLKAKEAIKTFMEGESAQKDELAELKKKLTLIV